MPQHYSDPSRASDPYALPDVEVFEAQLGSCPRCSSRHPYFNRDDYCPSCEHYGTNTGRASRRKLRPLKATAWYWQPCFPGCLPDSDPIGPFASEADALADAQGGE